MSATARICQNQDYQDWEDFQDFVVAPSENPAKPKMDKRPPLENALAVRILKIL